jgi:prophage antirepressor-like protein
MKTTADSAALLHFDNLELDTHIRVLVIDDAPLFVAKDICENLEIIDHNKAVGDLEDDERITITRSALKGSNTHLRMPNRGLQFVTESGLYALIFKSRKEAAKKFRKWVTSEVLPAIRRHGRYDPEAVAATLPPEAKAACLNTEADALLSRSHYLRHQAEIAVVMPGQITVLEFLRSRGIALQGGPVGRLSQACKLRADQLGIPCGFSRSATIAGRRHRLSRPARTFPEQLLAEVCNPA